jgi:ectoine hydroxylase-related dioxygenase (phytanoyl-CoA dioxygenase family)
MRDFIDCSGTLSSPQKLRLIFDENGYLFIRALIEPSVVSSLRAKVLTDIRAAGWTSGPVHENRLANPERACSEPELPYRKVHNQIWKLEEFHRIFHQPEIDAICRELLKAEILIHPRKVLRITFPQQQKTAKLPSPPHQDYPEVQGSISTITVWLPLHDCTPDDGGLAIASGSHKDEILPITYSQDWFGLQVQKPPMVNWHCGEMRVGDVLMFHSLTVHKGLPNVSDQLRISADCRYQRMRDPICENCLELIGQDLSWEEVYAGWTSPDLIYYWKRYALSIAPFSHVYEDERDRQLLEAAKRGDMTSLHGLRRVAEYNRSVEVRRLARGLLRSLSSRAR